MDDQEPIRFEEENHTSPPQDGAGYSQTTESAAAWFAQHGIQLAPRTLMWYCQNNILDCEKFANGKVLRWKITQDSLDQRLESLKREGSPIASNSAQLPASNPAGNSAQLPAMASEQSNEIVEILRDELAEKNRQIASFQDIVHEHNRQFENLNQTIQLSNQTIQQLNRTLALPQVREVVASMQQDEPPASRSWTPSDDTPAEKNPEISDEPDWQ